PWLLIPPAKGPGGKDLDAEWKSAESTGIADPTREHRHAANENAGLPRRDRARIGDPAREIADPTDPDAQAAEIRARGDDRAGVADAAGERREGRERIGAGGESRDQDA